MRRLSERKATGGQPVLRRLAVILQLAVSVVFIVATLVVMMQIRFVHRHDLGFDSAGVIRLSGFQFVPSDKAKALMYEFSSIPQIESISFAYFEPQHNANSETLMSEVEWPGKLPSENPVFHAIATDNRFAGTFGLKMQKGEWLDEVGENEIVLNEEAVRVMELSEPVGAIIRMGNAIGEFKVVGVVKDFHTLSLRSRILPTIFFISKSPIDILYARVTPGQEQEAIQRINAVLSGINVSSADVHLTTLNELYDRLNHSEQTGLHLYAILATVCLLISLFGIYAVASASTRRRRKEIAIRKVFGAEIGNVDRMFFREYILQVLVVGVIALPLAYYVMHRWLQGYAYHTHIPWWLLTGVITAVAIVVLLTVLGQVLKAAHSNPADVVKME
jgi:putative ABC transport system permease protein